MIASQQPVSFEDFLAPLRASIASSSPDLLADFDIYAGEALFGREWLEPTLKQLPPGSPVLEIGAGVLLLACRLQQEGFAVTALEPTSGGFGHFQRLQQVVLTYAAQQGTIPKILAHPAEQLSAERQFACIYSLNVMEHVADPQAVIVRAAAALAPGAEYQFVCPNYAFPFETHMKIPIIINKAVTFRLMQKKIRAATYMHDPIGVWESLNWITVSRVKRISRRCSCEVQFNRSIMQMYLLRAINDPSFCTRHPWIGRIIGSMQRLGLLRLLALIPVSLLPVMDCRLRPASAASVPSNPASGIAAV